MIPRLGQLLALLSIGTLLGISQPCMGYWEGFGPFRPGEIPEGYSLTEVTPDAHSDEEPDISWRFLQGPGYRFSVKEGEDSDENFALLMTDLAGKLLTSVSLHKTSMFGSVRVYAVDANGDGEPDFVIRNWFGGVGMAFDRGQWAILL